MSTVQKHPGSVWYVPAPAPEPRPLSVAEAQFVKNLERQAAREAEDARLVQAWRVRRARDVRAVARERKRLWMLAGVALVLGGALAVALLVFLISLGLTFWAAVALAVVLGGGSSSCCCTVYVTVVH